MTDVALSLLDGIAALPLWALALVVALAVTAESSLFVGLVVPGDIIVLLAASGGASPQRIVLLILAVAAGSVAGEAIGYGIGRRWGGRVRTSRPAGLSPAPSRCSATSTSGARPASTQSITAVSGSNRSGPTPCRQCQTPGAMNSRKKLSASGFACWTCSQ